MIWALDVIVVIFTYVNCRIGTALKSVKMNMISMEECELLSDSKYRAYTNQVEKALKNFEYTSEWADLISALTRLNKVSFFGFF